MNLLGGTLRKRGLNKFIFSDFRDFFQFLEKKIFIMKNEKKKFDAETVGMATAQVEL